MSKTTILQGPDGRLYEIPDQVLAGFAVPGDRVAELRRRLAQAQPASGAPAAGASSPASSPSSSSPGPGAALPPEHAAMPPGHAPPASLSMSAGGGVVLNFYFQAPPGAGAGAARTPSDLGVDGYHMTFDENGIPVNHTEMLWGDYIDKQGNPAVGWHSHDPVTGNAQ
jgi:hypothetical protein